MTKNYFPKKRKKDFVLIRSEKYFHQKQKELILKDAFNRKYKCHKCHSKKNLQIHHLYGYSPKDEIETFEEFMLIPWIPLCKKCHEAVHGIILPEEAVDD